jgi:F420-dependent oxidoreductase-like protein
MELGLHLANLTWTGGAQALRGHLARTAKEAEAAGLTRLTVMDHLWQIPGVGNAEDEMLEAYTTLGFLAGHTERVLLHTLVTGVVYRAPGMLAKQVSTLDALSGGRAGLGIGAAWFEAEALGLGLPFPPLGERFERLEETLQICLQMWGTDESAFTGRHYQLERTLHSPPPLRSPRPYVMVGGGGERKTLRLVAQYADACNLFGGEQVQHKLDVLRAHCDAVGRDFDEIEKTTTMIVAPDATRDSFLRQLQEARAQGFTVAYIASPASDPSEAVDLLASVLPEVAEA